MPVDATPTRHRQDETFSMLLSAPLFAALRAEADATGVSMAVVVRWALQRYPAIRKRLEAAEREAEAVGA